MAHSKPGAGRVKSFSDSSLDDIILVDQLDSDKWAEGIAIRPSGHALATIIDNTDLYSIDLRYSTEHASDDQGSDSAAPPKLLLKFPQGNAAINICRLPGTDNEEYAALSAHVDMAKQEFHTATLWRISFGPNGTPTTPTMTKITDLTNSMFGFGLYPVSEDTLLMADTIKGCIFRVHLPTGEHSVFFEHPSMSTSVGGGAFGINRLRVEAGYLWYQNTFTGILTRAPIEFSDDRNDIRVTGPPQTVVEGLQHNDGLVVLRDGSACYVSSYASGKLWRVDIDPETGKGTATLLSEDLISPTAMDLIYWPSEEKPTLYIICCGAWDPKQLEGDRGSWLNFTNVDRSKLRVHVTVETVVSYETIDPASQ